MHFQPVAIGAEPAPDFGVFVVGGVVLNQNGSTTPVMPGQLFQKTQVGHGIEGRVLFVVEARAPQFDRTQDLHALALSRDWNFGRMPHAAPGGVQRRVLAEAGFVGENQSPVQGLGFFFRFG